MDATADLWLDDDGGVWLMTGEDSRFVGHVGDPATSYRVPVGLLGRLAELEGEWLEQMEFGRACRETAEATYWRQRL